MYQFHTIYMKLCRKVAKFLIDNGVPTIGMNPMYWYHGKNVSYVGQQKVLHSYKYVFTFQRDKCTIYEIVEK